MGMRDRFRRSSEPPSLDFTVVGLDPGEWPGGVGAAVLQDSSGGVRGLLLRYDLLGGAPAYAMVSAPSTERPEGMPGPGRTAAAALLAAAGVDEAPGLLSEEADLATLDGEPVFITRTAYEDPQLVQVDFTRPDGTQVGLAAWGKPIGAELLSLLRPLPPEMFGAAPADSASDTDRTTDADDDADTGADDS